MTEKILTKEVKKALKVMKDLSNFLLHVPNAIGILEECSKKLKGTDLKKFHTNLKMYSHIVGKALEEIELEEGK